MVGCSATCILLSSILHSRKYPFSMSPNVRVIPQEKLFVSEPEPEMFGNGHNKIGDPTWSNENWLKSRFHFSFAEYNEWANSNYGVLRVMNDDLVQPHTGFGAHGHSNMEIITYIVHGSLTHQDSMGTKESLGRGSIQFMTAGKGIRHTEFNHGDQTLRFIQTWIVPTSPGLKQNYGSVSGANNAGGRKNQLQHLVSDVRDSSTSTPVEIEQDCDAYVAELDLGNVVRLEIPKGRMAYLLCIEGGVTANGKQLVKHDAAEIDGKGGNLVIECTHVEKTESEEVAHVLLFTMKEDPRAGRTDF